MPKTDFNLKTEFNYFSNVLIIDNLGELSTHLVDALLSRGCFVYYFGKENKENFYYLLGKGNFCFLNNLLEIDPQKIIDYVFFFPGSSQISLNQYLPLMQFPQSRVLISLASDLSKDFQLRDVFKTSGLNVRLVFFDALYGPRIKSSLLGKIFSSLDKEKTITISEDPQKEIYPVSGEKLITEIIRIMFSPDSRGNAYFLQTKKTDLQSFTQLVKNYLPDKDFAFSGHDTISQSDLSWMEMVEVIDDTEEKVLETITWFQRNFINSRNEEVIKREAALSGLIRPAIDYDIPKIKEPAEVEPETINQKIQNKGKLTFLFSDKRSSAEPLVKEKTSPFKKIVFGAFLFCLLFLVFFIGPLILSGVLGTVGIKKLVESKHYIDRGNFTDAKNQAKSAEKYLNISQKIVSASGPFYSLIGMEKSVGGLGEVLLFSQYINDSIRLSLEASGKVVELTKAFVNGEDAKWLEALGPVKANLSLAYEQASLAQSSLIGIETGFKVLKQNQVYDKLKKYLPEMRDIMLKGQTMISVLPKVLGIGERKTYLVLFQNNMEIRPTGGFIGSFGIVNLENGKFVSFEVFDVYQADGQLKGHVEPPAKLKQYLGEATWYLRDSNWDPKFSVSAKNAQWFLDKELQVTADGTIAITLEVIKNVLDVLKEIYVPEYNEKITAGNLFQKAEYYSELGTFPGSTQKKDFLGSLAKAIFERIKVSKEADLVNIGGALFSSLEQKEILCYFNDQEAQSAVSQLNWAGDIRGYQSKDDKGQAFADYLFINEANVGIDKANYFVKRKIDHQITLDALGKVKGNLEITYENQSPSENWPAGPYKNYLRLYLPQGTSISSVLVSDLSNSDLWIPYDLNLVDSSDEYGKSVFGLLINVPIKSKKKVAVSYELPNQLDLSKKINSYLLMLQKQSGAYPSDYSLVFNYPANFIPLRVIPSAVVGDQQLLISDKLTKDLIFQIDLAH